MAKINSSTFNDFVRNITFIWRKGYERVPMRAAQIYDISYNELAVTDVSSLDGFTFARRKTEGDNYRQENPVQNYNMTLTKYRIGLQAVITWEMRKYDRYREMRKQLYNLGQAAAQRLELDMTHRFTFGTATTYTDMDGVSVTISTGDALSLWNTAHTVTGSSTTFRNRVVNNPQFSRAALEAMESLFSQQMIDSQGNKTIIMPDTIITANDPQTENLVMEFLHSTAAPTLSNSGVENVYQGKYRHIVLPYLATLAGGGRDSTKEKYVILASLAHSDALCEISEEPHLIPPSPGSNSDDFDNDDWKFKVSAAYSLGVYDPKWAVITTGDNVA